ncbi:condensin complex subunit 2 [Sphingobacterium faecale]|nr:condensin complex subunit 2 [Sphingobacterium faecale]
MSNQFAFISDNNDISQTNAGLIDYFSFNILLKEGN